MSVSITEVTELVNNDGHGALFEMYDSITAVYPRLGRVFDPMDAGVPLKGDKGTVFTGHERFKERLEYQDVEKSGIKKAWTWRGRIRRYARGMVLDSDLLRTNGARDAVKAKIIEFARDRAEVAMLQKEDFIAGMFQQGTLTAGNKEYFDGSYVGEDDPNPEHIYDGLPWFDGAHTIVGGSDTFSNIATSRTLTQANLQATLTTMRHTNARNDRNERIMITPNVLLVPPGLEYDAYKILQSAQVTGSNNNDINPIRGALEPIAWSALSDAASASSWWTGVAGRGLRIWDSGAPRMWVSQRENGDLVVNTEYHFGAAVDNWRYWHACNKDDS